MITSFGIKSKFLIITTVLGILLACDGNYIEDAMGQELLLKRGGGGKTTSPITTSSIESSEYAAEYAFDNNIETRWASQHADPQWIKKDYGKSILIDKIILTWESAYATHYQIKISDNGKKWKTVFTETAGAGGTVEITLGGVSARYVQVYGTQRATSWGYSLYEITIIEGSSSTPECYSDYDCNDGSSCTDDVCNSGTCTYSDNGSCGATSCDVPENEINNCTFSEGLTGWVGDVFYSGTSGNQSVVDGHLTVSITNAGTATWEVQPRQEMLPLIQGAEYELSFTAWADAPRSMEVSLTQNQPDWISYSGTKSYALTTAPQPFSHSFTMNATTDLAAKLEFKLGGQGTIAVHLDDVSLIQTGGSTTPVPTCHDGIQNGDETGVDCGGSSCASCSTGSTGFYVGDGGQAGAAYRQLVSRGNTSDANLIGKIALNPQARWFGDWNAVSNVRRDVDGYLDAAEGEGADAVMVLYAIPARDCDAWSSGGLSAAEYIPWVREIAAAVGGRRPWIIVEPDAMPMLGVCEQGDRVGLLREATRILKATGARVYLDIGQTLWHTQQRRVEFITMIGAENLTGFASNVSNFVATNIERSGNDAVAAITGLSYIIDTSRNGNGSNGEWCNPRGRALGERPRVVNEGALDAYLWVKRPGESDGSCNGGPVAGEWWLDVALEMARNASY